MAAQALPPPGQDSGGPPQESGGQNPMGGGGSPVQDVLAIVAASRRLGMKFPGAAPIVQQINELVQQLQMKIQQSGPQPQTPAPPG